jgi:hypothetical protein
MRVFLLLDQDVRPLKVYPLAGKASKPVEVVPVGGIPGEVERSFHGAALAAYNVITKNGRPVSLSYLAYELEEDVARRIHGGSGGLAFAIATMGEMLGIKCNEVVGASGVIDTENGKVERVGAINEKIAKVIEQSPGITILLYPRQNDAEVSPELKKSALEQGIKLQPVQSLQEVSSILFGQEPQPAQTVGSSRVKLTIVAPAIFLMALYLAYGLSAHRLAVYLLENQHYPLARWHLGLATWAAFYSKGVKDLSKDFDTPIETDPILTLRYASGREETYPLDRIPPEFKLSDRDAFAFRIEPFEPVFVYILESQGPSAVLKLFPPDGETQAVTAPRVVPGRGSFFRLQGRSGNRDVFILLSKWRCRALERAFLGRSQTSLPGSILTDHQVEERSIQLKKIAIEFNKSQ